MDRTYSWAAGDLTCRQQVSEAGAPASMAIGRIMGTGLDPGLPPSPSLVGTLPEEPSGQVLLFAGYAGPSHES